MDFRGLLGYPITPTDDDGGLDLGSLQTLVARGSGAGLSAVGVLGSSGGFAYLDRQERRDVVRAAVEAAGRTPVAAGISAPGLREVLQHAADAERAGAAGLILSPVSYQPLSDAEVLGLVTAVAARTSLPICLYNNPRTTRYSFPLEVVATLAALDAVVAFKDSAPSAEEFLTRYRALAARLPEGFAHGMSGDLLIATAGIAADGWHSGPAALLPEPYLALRAATGSGNAALIRGARSRLVPLLEVVARMPKGSVLHSLARLTGIRSSHPRLPLLPLTAGQEAELAAAVGRFNGAG
ncbi:MAG: dihydrodipicolinate synthase family protein [Actinomycetales bacterium]